MVRCSAFTPRAFLITDSSDDEDNEDGDEEEGDGGVDEEEEEEEGSEIDDGKLNLTLVFRLNAI